MNAPPKTSKNPPIPEVQSVPGVPSDENSGLGGRLPSILLAPADILLLSQTFGVNIRSRDDLVRQCKSLSTMSVGGVEISLEPGLLSRLKSRAVRQDFPTWLREETLRLLHGFVGW